VAYPILLRNKEANYCDHRKSQACLIVFNTVCSYISTRDFVQERITFKVWPLAADWEMSKDTEAGSSQNARRSSLVYMRYT
jgi:hypothetical protein